MMQTIEHTLPSMTTPYQGCDMVTAKAKTPLRFWEIQDFFRCPVVGMCLTLAEQKQLLKKTKMTLKNATPFDIHEAIVSCAGSENRLSKKVQRLLQRKFGPKATELLELDDETFMAHFKSSTTAGDHLATLWAAAIHPNLPADLKMKIFGQIHMNMHWNSQERMKLKHKLTCCNHRLEDMDHCNKTIARQKRALKKENQTLIQNQDRLKRALFAAEQEIERLRNGPANKDPSEKTTKLRQEHIALIEKLDTFSKHFQKQKDKISVLKAKNRRLNSQIDCLKSLGTETGNQFQIYHAETADKNSCKDCCPSFDLCQKRILIVGGMSRMESLYRKMIETNGGLFEYHDGYMKKGSRTLETRLKRADVVICPVNCNSHTACSMVKNLSKKYDKTLHMLSNFSLKAITLAIRGAANHHTLN